VPADIEIRAARGADLELATAWLVSEGLPTDDLTAAHMDSFFIATQSAQPVGMIGLERYNDIGLLRSLLVASAQRHSGLGARLVAALEDQARRLKLRELWLLTIDAEGFFARLDYFPMERALAPLEIQTTPEFSSLCPGDAALMRKIITHD
jgi:amino-acid N-acetyltransferase